MLNTVDVAKLRGEKIRDICFGHPQKQETTDFEGKYVRTSYGVITLKMESGKVFVISGSMLHSELSFWTEN